MKRAIVIAVAMVLAATPAHADDDDPFDGGTIGGQVAVGTLTGVAGCGALGLAGVGIGHLIDSTKWGVPLAGAMIGCVTGGAVGLVLGVDLMGDERGANGTVLGTSLGLLGGAVVFASFESIAYRAGWRVPTSGHVLVGVLSFVGGSIIGYHLTVERDVALNKRSFPVLGFVF